MKKETLIQMIAASRQTHGMLTLIDEFRDKSEITLGELQRKFEKQYGFDPKDHYFCNQHFMILSLLPHIVLPKEIEFDNIPDNVRVSNLKEEWGLTHLDQKYKLRYVIRRLRNAIVHGRIEVSEDLIFTFKDIDPKNPENIFEISFNKTQLLNFTQAFAYWLITKDIQLKDLVSTLHSKIG